MLSIVLLIGVGVQPDITSRALKTIQVPQSVQIENAPLPVDRLSACLAVGIQTMASVHLQSGWLMVAVIAISIVTVTEIGGNRRIELGRLKDKRIMFSSNSFQRQLGYHPMDRQRKLQGDFFANQNDCEMIWKRV